MMLAGSNIEYKVDIPKDEDKLKAEIVSFLNGSSRGIIFLGVDDNGNEINFCEF